MGTKKLPGLGRWLRWGPLAIGLVVGTPLTRPLASLVSLGRREESKACPRLETLQMFVKK